jgi:hypothetical protein
MSSEYTKGNERTNDRDSEQINRQEVNMTGQFCFPLMCNIQMPIINGARRTLSKIPKRAEKMEEINGMKLSPKILRS